MNLSPFVFGLLMLGASMTIVTPADARVVKAVLGLTQEGATCDGRGTYGYVLRWASQPAAAFQVNSGNQCKMQGAVCSISGKDCVVHCDANGKCSSHVSGCVVGKGAPWIKVTATNATVFQQITATGPGKCQ